MLTKKRVNLSDIKTASIIQQHKFYETFILNYSHTECTCATLSISYKSL